MITDFDFSKHFIQNWRERVGGEPNKADVTRILSESVRVQKGQLLKKPNGMSWNTLSIYWHPVKNVIIKIDNFAGVAVTVLSDKLMERGRYGG